MDIMGSGHLTHDVLIWNFYKLLSPMGGTNPGLCILMSSVILVDSTRRGKRMPDALSKTVPIWCAVINRSVAKGEPWKKMVFPKDCVSEQEISSIESMIPTYATSFKVVISVPY